MKLKIKRKMKPKTKSNERLTLLLDQSIKACGYVRLVSSH